MTDFIETKLKSFGYPIEYYVEPYAGGAGGAMNLLRRGAVKRVILNDLDVRLYSAWRALLEENERFVEQLMNVPVTISTWNRCRSLVDAPADGYSFDLGFATFFINRTSRAGIILGSGPIGGREQNGDWKIDARFYRDTLVGRCRWIGENASNIVVQRESALTFLWKCSLSLPKRSAFYFIDPPYVGAGSRLYFNGMSRDDHKALAQFLRGRHLKNWILTYDNSRWVRGLYPRGAAKLLEVGYSLHASRRDSELLFASC